jgi:phage-related protein
MSTYKCIYFSTDSGRTPAEEFVDSLHSRTQQKFFEAVRLLQNYGKSLPKPHSDLLGDEIYELRFTGIEGNVRILYFFYYENKIIFTNGFIKKQQKAPRTEVELAKERRKLYIEKHKR